jgi:hypothetical protein
MRKFLALGVALATLSVAVPALAQDNDSDAAAGAAVGATTGGTIGFFLGGPIGAIFGGWAGAVLGADAAVDEASIRFAGEHPVDVVLLEGELEIGAVLDADVEIHAIEGDDEFGYIYANNRVWIVDLETREIVHSPGFIVREDVVAFVQENELDSIEFEGELEAGVVLDADIEVAEIPDEPNYGYIWVDGRPVLVELGSRTVIWVDED